MNDETFAFHLLQIIYVFYFSTGYRNTSCNHKNNSLEMNVKTCSQLDMSFDLYAILFALFFSL